MLVLMLLLIWGALAVLLLTATLFLQGYLYTEPTPGLTWRVPAAATIFTVFLALWTYLAVGSPGSYDTLFRFSPREEKEFKTFDSIRNGKRSTFELHKTAQGRPEFRDTQTKQRWNRSDSIIVKEDGKDVQFNAERDANGNFKIETTKVPAGMAWVVGSGSELPLRYRDASGRIMTEDAPGFISVSRWGRFLANIFLNGFHFVIWFGCLWLLLHYQWPHALGGAAFLWLVLTLTVLPMVLDRAEEVGGQRKSLPTRPS